MRLKRPEKVKMAKNKEKNTIVEEKSDYTKLADQCKAEYSLAWKHQKPKRMKMR